MYKILYPVYTLVKTIVILLKKTIKSKEKLHKYNKSQGLIVLEI